MVNRWCEISKLLPGRTENAVKNRWNSCAMKKWLKDRNLEPGPNNALKSATKAEMQHAVANFKKALVAAGVELKVDASHALTALRNDNISDEDSDSGSDGEPQITLRNDREAMIKVEGETSPQKESSSSQKEGGNTTVVPTDKKDSNFVAPLSQPSLSMQLPAFLRPQPIVIGAAEERKVELDRDESTLEIVGMLNMLKKSPMSSLADQQLLASCGGPEGILSKHLQEVAQKRKRQRAGMYSY